MSGHSPDRIMAPHGFRLEPSDEDPHPPDDAVNFNESVYVNGFDPRLRVGGWMRLGNRSTRATPSSRSACTCPTAGSRASSPGQASRPTTAFDAGGLRYAVDEPFERVEMHYEGELLLLDDPSVLRDPKRMFATAPRVDGEVHMHARAVSPAHGGEPTAPEHEDMMLYGYEFSRGHFNQHIAVRGTMRVGDGGVGARRLRLARPLLGAALLAGDLVLPAADRQLRRGPRVHASAQHVGGRHSRRFGVLLIDGRYEEVIDLDVTTEWSADRRTRWRSRSACEPRAARP